MTLSGAWDVGALEKIDPGGVAETTFDLAATPPGIGLSNADRLVSLLGFAFTQCIVCVFRMVLVAGLGGFCAAGSHSAGGVGLWGAPTRIAG